MLYQNLPEAQHPGRAVHKIGQQEQTQGFLRLYRRGVEALHP